MTQIQDVITYFSQFVSKGAIQKLFAKESKLSGYTELKTSLLAIGDSARNDQITDFVLGINEATVSKVIALVKGMYMFVDFGNIESQESEAGTKNDSFLLSITVAKPLSANMLNNIEEMLLLESTLNIISGIRKKMREDTNDRMTYPLMQQIVWPNSITPFYARDLSSSIGWSLVFSRKGVDMI